MELCGNLRRRRFLVWKDCESMKGYLDDYFVQVVICAMQDGWTGQFAVTLCVCAGLTPWLEDYPPQNVTVRPRASQNQFPTPETSPVRTSAISQSQQLITRLTNQSRLLSNWFHAWVVAQPVRRWQGHNGRDGSGLGWAGRLQVGCDVIRPRMRQGNAATEHGLESWLISNIPSFAGLEIIPDIWGIRKKRFDLVPARVVVQRICAVILLDC